MNHVDILKKCVLCPGICSYKCPVYNSTGYRASAPVNIARALYFSKYLAKESYTYAIGLCSLCMKCMEICPINNPLPEVIAETRMEKYSIEPIEFNEDSNTIYVYKPIENHFRLNLSEEFRIEDTSKLYRAVSYGYIKRQELKNSYNEDPDVFLNRYSIQLLKEKGIKVNIEGYILHIPCKLNQTIVKDFREVFGKEENILSICLGGGGVDMLAPELLSRIMKNLPSSNRLILTQCSRAAKRLREWGFEAYTPLEVVSNVQ